MDLEEVLAYASNRQNDEQESEYDFKAAQSAEERRDEVRSRLYQKESDLKSLQSDCSSLQQELDRLNDLLRKALQTKRAIEEELRRLDASDNQANAILAQNQKQRLELKNRLDVLHLKRRLRLHFEEMSKLEKSKE